MQTASEYMQGQGFHLAQTGGGCDAFRRDADNGTYILVTVDGDPQAPQQTDEPVLAGLYGAADQDGRALAWINADNLSELVARIRRGEWVTK